MADDGADRGAIIIYSDGPNGEWGSKHSITKGVVSVSVPGSNKLGKDDMSIVVFYTNVNGYGETAITTSGFSNNQGYLTSGQGGSVGIIPDNGGEKPSVPNYDISVLMANEYVVFDGNRTLIKLCEDGIVMNGVLTIPDAYLTYSNNQVIVSGTSEFDGVFTFCDDGYLERDGDVIGKSVKMWLNVPDGYYFIVRNGIVYDSYDGNALESIMLTESSVEYALQNVDDFNINEEYVFKKYDGTLRLENVFDLLSMEAMFEDPMYFICCGGYKYWGGHANNYKRGDSLVVEAKWNSNNVYLIEKTSMDDVLVNGVYVPCIDSAYYHDGVQTENIFFVDDYPFYFDDGMTYREWMLEYGKNATVEDYYSEYTPFFFANEIDQQCQSLNMWELDCFVYL